jgi:DNA-binding response OmpR family regulator
MPTILIVEDNELNSDMLSRRLKRKEFEIRVAFDGEDGVHKAKTEPPDLILMDLSLPKIDGWEATRQIKAVDRLRHIPIIALTAHTQAGDRERALEAGCDDYETKPIDFRRLMLKIRTHLNLTQHSSASSPGSMPPARTAPSLDTVNTGQMPPPQSADAQPEDVAATPESAPVSEVDQLASGQIELQPGMDLGSYKIVGLLGVGGMGAVYRARDTTLGRDVAIKVLLGQFAENAERLERFKREARILASLNHAHIASVYELQEQRGVWFLVMQLVEGTPLSEMILSRPMKVEDVVPIFAQIAEAMEAAHEQGVVHRDLKPANIMIGQDNHVSVLDFGLAKALEHCEL